MTVAHLKGPLRLRIGARTLLSGVALRAPGAKPQEVGLSEWDFDLIERYGVETGKVASEFGLDTYPHQVEIITTEQMLDAYASSSPAG